MMCFLVHVYMYVCTLYMYVGNITVSAFLTLQLPQKLDEFDNDGNIPLNLALLGRNEGIANTLVSHNCDLDLVDPSGNSLLHLAILRGDSFSASFLIKNGANTILARKENQETPLHLVASYKPSQVHCLRNAATIARRLLVSPLCPKSRVCGSEAVHTYTCMLGL